jgi:hypothetical protein
LDNGFFNRDKNIAFAVIKEFFVKYKPEDLSSGKLSNMLSEDINNLFFHVKNMSEKNKEAITKLTNA